MNGKIRLDIRKQEERKEGFPVCVFMHHKGQQKKINLGIYFSLKEWDLEKQMPIKNPAMHLFIRKKQLLLDELIFDYKTARKGSLAAAKKIFLGTNEVVNSVSYYDFYNVFLQELKEKQKNASYNIYSTAFDRLKEYRNKLDFDDLDYNLLNGFKNWRIKEGNAKNTIHTYIRKYRAVYNEAAKRGIADDKKPFVDVFKGITVKSNRTKKKSLTKADIIKLETAENLTFAEKRSADLFLLLFYFGGQDLKDVYYLEYKNISKNRVFFRRGKLDGAGYQFDLKIPEKAQKIMDAYTVKGVYLFKWRKDFEGYKTFRDNFRRSILKVQKKLEIEVQPLGGNLGIKVARHTFANIGKNLFIDTDLLRELMGHERDGVDTIYKDRYPQKIRDEAHEKIIN
jgi:hypothetical protein